MVTIGNNNLPGTIQTIESARTASAGLDSPAVPFIIGQGYLSSGQADPNEAKRITRATQARQQFGPSENSMLTTAIQDAIVEGANPVYAVAPEPVSVTGEDLSGETGNLFSLANAPVLEAESDVTFTIDGSEKDTVFYYEGALAHANPDSDEVYLNPVTGEGNSGTSLGSAGDSVDYKWLDYANTYDAITDSVFGSVPAREVADFLVLIQENNTQVTNVRDKSEAMETEGWFNIAMAGAGEPWIQDSGTSTNDVQNYSNSEDTSRLQLVSPTRTPEGNTLLGAWAGVKARVGIESTPIHKYFRNTYNNTIQRYSRAQKEKLVSENVVPLEPTSRGVKIREDMTTVQDGNLTEASWKQATARLITDYTADNVGEAADPFVGEFNNPGVRSNIESAAQSILNGLLEQGSVDNYSLDVLAASDTRVVVDIGLDTADPLKNIHIRVVAGKVQGGVQSENAEDEESENPDSGTSSDSDEDGGN